MIRHWSQALLGTALACMLLAVQAVATATASDFLTPEFRSMSPSKLSASPGSFDDFSDSSFGSSLGSGMSYDDDQKPWRVSSGMRISPFVSLEIGYQDFGRNTDSPTSQDAAGWSLAGMLSLPLSHGVAPYARLGQMFWGRDRSSNALSSNADGGRDLFYGIGMRFGLAEQLNMNFEYERFELEQSDFDVGSMNLEISF